MSRAAASSPPSCGAFGEFGGRFVPELLLPALEALDRARLEVLPDPAFRREFEGELASWAGRPTPLTFAPHLSERAEAPVYLKREDLLHGGAHKTNNVVGQALLAKAMGKRRIIAETGAGQHGVATAMAGARFGLETVVYMGAVDVERQRPNVQRMELCGATVVPVASGSATLKDAINEALRDWAGSVADTHYLLGSVCGPHPFPTLVRDLHAVIGREARAQLLEATGALPAAAIACVGGGSNAIGLFHEFVGDAAVRLLGAEPGGEGLASGRHGATLSAGTPGLLHGARTLVLQDDDGQIQASHSVSAGLDYPGVGPEHAALARSGRARYLPVTDAEALDAFELLCRAEGILPALESAHAIALALRAVREGLVDPAAVARGAALVVNLSGRGDKDLDSHAALRRAGGGS